MNLGLSDVVETFDVTAYCAGYLSDWSIDTPAISDTVDPDNPDVDFDPYYLTDSDAGITDFNVTTYDEDGYPDDFVVPFDLRRYSTWGTTFNAGPEPIKKGGTISFSGELLRANWDLGQYFGYGNGYTHLDFRPAGASAFTTVKTFRTSTVAVGHITGLSVKATVSGFWRVYYTGNQFGSSAYSTIDYVGVV